MALSKSCDELSPIHFPRSLARRNQDAHGNIVMGTDRRGGRSSHCHLERSDTLSTDESTALVVGACCDRWRSCGKFLVFVLQLVKLVVNTAVGEQLLVRADLAHLAFMHNDDLVGSLNRR